jgi:hypothetical protein
MGCGFHWYVLFMKRTYQWKPDRPNPRKIVMYLNCPRPSDGTISAGERGTSRWRSLSLGESYISSNSQYQTITTQSSTRFDLKDPSQRSPTSWRSRGSAPQSVPDYRFEIRFQTTSKTQYSPPTAAVGSAGRNSSPTTASFHSLGSTSPL